jgi:hypothetical protein
VDTAGAIHDWLYRIQANRAVSDGIWVRVAMAGEHRANAFQASLGWVALRLFGHGAYRKAMRPKAAEKAPES